MGNLKNERLNLSLSHCQQRRCRKQLEYIKRGSKRTGVMVRLCGSESDTWQALVVFFPPPQNS